MSQVYNSEVAELVPCAGTFFPLARSQQTRTLVGQGPDRL